MSSVLPALSGDELLNGKAQIRGMGMRGGEFPETICHHGTKFEISYGMGMEAWLPGCGATLWSRTTVKKPR